MKNDVPLSIDPQVGPAFAIAVKVPDKAVVHVAIDNACGKIAPLWPLKHFVAVNPFLGFTDSSFASTCAIFRRVAGVNMLMPRAFYREAIARGQIEDRDLDDAIARTRDHPVPARDAADLRRAALRDPVSNSRPKAVVATVAEVLDRLATGDRQASRTAFMIDEISKWCAAYFDEGQAAWQLPERHLQPYEAWLASMRFDRNPEAMGIKGFRKTICAMPDDPRAAIYAVIKALAIPEAALEDYLHRALIDISGWAAYARYRVWENDLNGHEDDTLVQLLAIRVVWGFALFRERTDAGFQAAWAEAMREAASLPGAGKIGEDPDLILDLALHSAYEAAYQRKLVARLKNHFLSSAEEKGISFQAAFCIDVRSEVYRRALESVCPAIETRGFAGFFGFPIEYVPIGRERGGAQCPVLLKPTFIVCETVAGAPASEEKRILELRLLRRRAAKAWKSFKLSAVSSFTYVETAGLLFAAKLAGDSAGVTRAVGDPNTDGLDRNVIGRIGPRLESRVVGGRVTGFNPDQRVAMAEAVLRAMSMTDRFARLILLVGHGSTTVNNPHASGLDCGACGGHTGEANARVAAAILNDPDVRVGLAGRGIEIPDDSWFLGSLHDTTTDRVDIFDANLLPATHADDLAQLRAALNRASSAARLERASMLGIEGDKEVGRAVMARSRDWSQVRPEWGLAGNAAFIAAPRSRTRDLDLEGRAFLHEYDWRKDEGFGVLALIMTAPMVVASWINLQYYGSTVNNPVFGSGNKVLHNVVGQLGVLEGNAGDLKVGLPWQSVHDGTRFVHEPLRLNVFIEAPEEAINRTIAAHESVRHLVDNGWIHLFRMHEDLNVHRYVGDLSWEAA